jgi:hypothetical protein
MKNMKDQIQNLLSANVSLEDIALHIGPFSSQSPDSLASYAFLAYDLYVYGNTPLVKAIVDLLDNQDFDGNHDKWTFVRHGMTLKSWIANEEGCHDEVAAIKSKILAALEKGKNDLVIQTNKNVFKRKINGDMLDYASVDSAASAGDTKMEEQARRNLLYDLLLIFAVGGSEKFPAGKAEVQIRDNIRRLKELASQI